jgi:hypothetical protein
LAKDFFTGISIFWDFFPGRPDFCFFFTAPLCKNTERPAGGYCLPLYLVLLPEIVKCVQLLENGGNALHQVQRGVRQSKVASTWEVIGNVIQSLSTYTLSIS